MDDAVEWVRARLRELSDEQGERARRRSAQLRGGAVIPTHELHELARELSRQARRDAFLDALPHDTPDENLLHAMIVHDERPYDRAKFRLCAFVPYVHDVRVCDQLAPPILAERRLETQRLALGLMARERQPYAMRVGITLLSTFFLGEWFDRRLSDVVITVRCDSDCVRRAQAHYVAEALVHQELATLPLLERHLLDRRTHALVVRHIQDSRRAPADLKRRLRELDRPG